MASASPQRAALLRQLGLEARVLPSAEEPLPFAGEKPADFVLRSAACKALSILFQLDGVSISFPELRRLVNPWSFFPALPLSERFASDPTVSLCDAAAKEALSVLYARESSFYHSDCALLGDKLILGADTVIAQNNVIFGKPVDSDDAFLILSKLVGSAHHVFTGCAVLSPAGLCLFWVRTVIVMRSVSEQFLRDYVSGGEPMGKAGAYAIQGLGAGLVRAVYGSWSNVVGLPITELLEVLLRFRLVHEIE